MRLAILLAVLLLAGCATSRTTIVVSGEFDGVEVAAQYELRPLAKDRK
jgi:uncharacterized lipoprotein YajG